ncbi:MAG: small ribosomal subunit biogenesis GTPase RsgA [Gammaproteobacteria bacterium]|nr:small ribosomal subunit biogenesis GTPase RsgA [Gammaproteobacteria bacterium]
MAQRKLTQKQKEHIKRIQEKRRERLAKRADKSLEQHDGDAPLEGRVIARHGQNLAVADNEGNIHHCLSRQNIGHIVCGDRVVWQATEPGNGVVTACLERSSVLARPDYSGREKPLAANITLLVIVIAPEPEPSEYLLDQYLVTAETIGVPALIAINKADLISGTSGDAFNQRIWLYQDIGYPTIQVSAHTRHGLDPMFKRLKGETSILVGQSGVGKSSIINALLPNLDLQVGQLSDATGLGRHTTSASTCYSLPSGGELIDSPGVRSFRLLKLSRSELENGFRDFHPFLGHCQFNDCKHLQEPDCAIKQAVERGEISQQRLDNFLHLTDGMSKGTG